MSLKKQIYRLLCVVLICPLFLTPGALKADAIETSIFFDDFQGNKLDTTKWLTAFKQWGGNNANGGVLPQNVSVQDGKLVIEAYGYQYTGDVKGINRDFSLRPDGKRVGGAIATLDYYASGKYEVRMKVAPQLGVASAIWTFHYEEYEPGDPMYKNKPVGGEDYYAVNHEIDMEFPGRPGPAHTNFSFDRGLFNTWIGENDDEYTTEYASLGQAVDDGQFHTYRFDWHTGDDNEQKRVEFYIDDVLIHTTTDHVPTHASRLWIGAWFPNSWAGTPDFDIETLEVDWVKITPFEQEGDNWFPETYPNDGWSYLDPTIPEDVFYDDFTSSSLDPGNWMIAKKNWGGQLSRETSFNGGVVPQNVKLRDGNLVLEAHGNYYNGPVMGINKNGSQRTDGKRVGAAVATTNYYASGSYEVRMKVAPDPGVASALWTFHYEELYPDDPGFICKEVGCGEDGDGYYAINHEIDIEFPGRPGPAHQDFSFSKALLNTWIGENDDEYTTNYTTLSAAQNDGQFHTYRFDWHTGDTGQTPRVEFYVDDQLVNTTYTHIPTRASRFWIGAWFPRGWAGKANFDTSELEIDWVRITPFHQAGDEEVMESVFPGSYDFAQYSEYPKASSGGPVTPTPTPTITPTPIVTPTPTITPTPTVTLTPTPSGPPAVNLIQNGDFSGTQHWTDISTAPAIAELSAGQMKLQPATTFSAEAEQLVSVTPSETYTLRADMNSSDGQTFGYLRVYDGTSVYEVGSSSGSVQNKQLTFTASGSQVRVVLHAYKGQTGSFYFDNVELVKQ
ncbi:glycoside hydrolase family 16 protein [Paenibacillus sp. GXUN7292]|uniref:glycoside hydrolase family 16 protein n=1 Tax=Paenibacillus sp. GXUN7292 TaxID=3422499 RepID=UPI003D7D6EF1